MPPEKKPGRRRLEIVAEPEWIDLVSEAATAADRSVSSYIRTAVNAQMTKDGFSPNAGSVKSRGRPSMDPAAEAPKRHRTGERKGASGH